MSLIYNNEIILSADINYDTMGQRELDTVLRNLYRILPMNIENTMAVETINDIDYNIPILNAVIKYSGELIIAPFIVHFRNSINIRLRDNQFGYNALATAILSRRFICCIFLLRFYNPEELYSDRTLANESYSDLANLAGNENMIRILNGY